MGKKVYLKSQILVHEYHAQVLDNTKPSLWITPAHSKERKYHIFRQYWYTRNVPVFTNTGTVQYLGPKVYFFHPMLLEKLTNVFNGKYRWIQEAQNLMLWSKMYLPRIHISNSFFSTLADIFAYLKTLPMY